MAVKVWVVWNAGVSRASVLTTDPFPEGVPDGVVVRRAKLPDGESLAVMLSHAAVILQQFEGPSAPPADVLAGQVFEIEVGDER